LFAGLHLSAAASNVVFQETVRAHIRSFYERLVNRLPEIVRGTAALPPGPGLGVRLHDELFIPDRRHYRRSDWRDA
jgi:L-alanine-DL-glutamate epimerase-like enolase superfamily enzyme